MPSFIKSIFVSLLCISVIACGWQLRGQAGLPAELQTLSLDVPPLSNALEKDILRSLKTGGIEVVQEANAVLRISGETMNKRTASIAANARTGEYALDYSFSYELVVDEKQVRRNSLSATRSYVFDLNNLAAMSQEEQLLRSEMRRDLIQRLLRELGKTQIQ